MEPHEGAGILLGHPRGLPRPLHPEWTPARAGAPVMAFQRNGGPDISVLYKRPARGVCAGRPRGPSPARVHPAWMRAEPSTCCCETRRGKPDARARTPAPGWSAGISGDTEAGGWRSPVTRAPVRELQLSPEETTQGCRNGDRSTLRNISGHCGE